MNKNLSKYIRYRVRELVKEGKTEEKIAELTGLTVEKIRKCKPQKTEIYDKHDQATG